MLHLMSANLENSAMATGLEHQFLFQSQKRAMPKNVQTTMQLHSFHMLARLCSKSFKLGFNSMWTENFQLYKLGLEKAEEPEIKLPTFLDQSKEKVKELQKSIYFCFTDYDKAFDCLDCNIVVSPERD